MSKLFGLHIEVEEVALGRVMRQLHNTPGVAKVNIDLGTPKKSKGNGALPPRGRRFAVNAQTVVLEMLSKGDMTTRELYPAFAAIGRKPSSSQSALNLAKKAKHVTKLKDGKTWSLTAKGKAALDKAAAAAAPE